nr:CDP-alcohol phosphatidyltransferase [uncultured Bacteroides sp.]
MKNNLSREKVETLSTISKGRHRTNLLKVQEQKALAFFVQRIPEYISSDMLTAIGFMGSVLTASSFILAAYINIYFLLLGVLGLAINWFGDSLDGRVAYYRNTPRKWYGFSLDITVDWITDILIGIGYMIYVGSPWYLIGYGFIVMYGWEMITTLLRYKITDKYSIDSGLFGPTEVRIFISLILVLEVFFEGSIVYSGGIICIMLFIANINDTRNLLRLADSRDITERATKMNENK